MEIIDATILAKVKFVTLFGVSYLDRKGRTRCWHMVSRGEQPKCITGERRRPDAAIIVPYHRRANKLVVIKEYRIPVGGYQHGFPAGLLDPGEELAAAAGRELREETGLALVSVYRHSPAIFSSAGITDEAIAMVFVEVDGTPSIRHNTDSEDRGLFDGPAGGAGAAGPRRHRFRRAGLAGHGRFCPNGPSLFDRKLRTRFPVISRKKN